MVICIRRFGNGVVIEVVRAFKISCVMVVMVVDSKKVRVGIRIVREVDGMDVVIVLEALEDFGGGVVVIPKVMYGGRTG